ncbi:uncharacterized protein C8Q71DRAFT_586889 [Rhodofomes roseus]|uniref:DH domain-containing protein n=1 Tax=Rhodofomes roseus TaxID=34475 RepID=A0ABQ8KID3_9APHY|nr:uncharacterized protein C8Q71DRAFT_586889 [Rhodofomes roseus]KAH9837133.1 hypothetical protein C8Q71DRAFT_586889 [Rhodofomes roseus]
MNGDAGFDPSSKPLPPPAAHEKLPSLPPRDSGAEWAPPPPPDKDVSPRSPGVKLSRSQVDLSQSVNAEPATPSTPSKGAQFATVPPSPGGDARGKKVNPLTDLIETEKEYVDRLAGIIRKVAGAWSRSNLPPPDLDTMFRSIESIYKANRSLVSKLKDIGANPSSPKALGDLLMRWVDDLETPYTAYCTKYVKGFDTWEPVQSNDRLRTTLAIYSASNPPPLPPSSPLHPSEPPLWTLDQLFLLPKERLNYYRKLYSRLLKGTSPGRSDHRLLSSAMDKLGRLLNTLDDRLPMDVASVSTYVSPPPAQETEDEVVIDMRGRKSLVPHGTPVVADVPPLPTPGSSGRPEPSNSVSSSQTPPRPEPSTVAALERRLSAERTLDIFTMQPRQIRLQLSPPTLHYTRELRFSVDVTMRFTPRSTGTEMVHELGHVFILTDLLVLAERMKPRERAQYGPDGPDMWLVYPPLAGKYLRVSPVGDSETALSVSILRKENMTLHTSTPALRDRLYSEFAECIDAAASLSSSAKSPPAPGPPALPTDGSRPPSGPHSPISRPPSGPQGSSRPPSAGVPSERFSGSMSPSSVRTPHSGPASLPGGSPPVRSSSSSGDVPPMEHMVRLALGDPPAHRPAEHQQPAPSYPSRTTSMSSWTSNDGTGSGGLSRQPSFNVGQVMPSQLGGQQPPMPSFRPGQAMPPQGPPMHPGPQGPGGPPQGFGPGQVMPPMGGRPPAGLPQSPYGPGRGGMPPPGGPPSQFGQQMPPGPGRGMPPPGPGMGGPQGFMGPGPQRGPSLLRSASSDPPYRNPAPMGMPPGADQGPNPPFAQPQYRAPSDPSFQGGLRKSTSSRSLRPQYEMMSTASAPPMPQYPGDLPSPNRPFGQRNGSTPSLYSLPSQPTGPPQPPLLPSEQLRLAKLQSQAQYEEPSPPASPVLAEAPQALGPTSTSVTAQMKCKVFLQQQHAQWKSLGTAKLKLYRESPTNVKQLVVEAEDKNKSVLISTIVLVDGVERVGKTGVAVELSDRGRRSGMIYMLQLRNEKSAGGLFDSLIAGSDRSAG